MKLSWVGMTATAIAVGAGPAWAVDPQNVPGDHGQLSLAKRASELKASALIALGKGETVRAVQNAETATMLLPNDAGMRALLGRAYLSAGRFRSAEIAFGDALSLDPALPRAAVSRALAQIALGNPDGARESLGKAEGVGTDADIGLAEALLGDTETARKRLDAAAREPGADVRTRQNLGLAYALEGRWTDAVAVIANDVPADMMPQRLHRWAMIAQMRNDPAMQVGAILGVLPAEDGGQPAALALVMPPPAASSTGPEPLAVAAASDAEPIISKVIPIVHVDSGAVVTTIHPVLPPLELLIASRPVTIPPMVLPILSKQSDEPSVLAQTAILAESAPAASHPIPVSPASKVNNPQAFVGPPRMRSAARRSTARWSSAHLRKPKPVVLAPATAAVFGRPNVTKSGVILASEVSVKPVPPKSLGGWAVQLGAFSSHGRREIAWGKLTAKASFLSAYAPTGSGRKLGNAMLYRLSVSGLPSRKDAVNLCVRIKAAGGECFVRNMRGDEPMRWAMHAKASQRA